MVGPTASLGLFPARVGKVSRFGSKRVPRCIGGRETVGRMVPVNGGHMNSDTSFVEGKTTGRR